MNGKRWLCRLLDEAPFPALALALASALGQSPFGGTGPQGELFRPRPRDADASGVGSLMALRAMNDSIHPARWPRPGRCTLCGVWAWLNLYDEGLEGWIQCQGKDASGFLFPSTRGGEVFISSDSGMRPTRRALDLASAVREALEKQGRASLTSTGGRQGRQFDLSHQGVC